MKLLVVKETMFLKSHEPFRDVELVIIYTTYIAGRGGGQRIWGQVVGSLIWLAYSAQPQLARYPITPVHTVVVSWTVFILSC